MNINLFLNTDEAKFAALAVTDLLERVIDVSRNPKTQWNADSKKYFDEMVEAGTAVKAKLGKLGFTMSPVTPYVKGDGKDFVTNEH